MKIVEINGIQKVKQFKSHVHLVGERHLMVNNLLLGFVLFSLTSVGLVSANAEEFSYEPSFEWQRSGCSEFFDGIYPLAQCYMEGTRDFAPDVQWNEETKTYIPTEQMVEEAKAEYEEFIAEQQAEMTREEKAIANILKQDDDSISAAEKQLVVMANKIQSTCMNDILAMQTYQEFEVATDTYIDENGNERLQLFKNWDLVAIDLKAHQLLKNGKMATEHCLAQEKLNKSIFSLNIYGEPSYEGKDVCVYGCNTYHAEHTYTEEFQAKVYSMMETGGNVVASPTLRDVICNSDTIGNWFKQQQACPIIYSPSTIAQPLNSFWSDEARDIMQARADYDDSDQSQYDKVREDAINTKMENLR